MSTMNDIAENATLKAWARLSMAVMVPVFVFMLGYFANKIDTVLDGMSTLNVKMAEIKGEMNGLQWRLAQLEAARRPMSIP